MKVIEVSAAVLQRKDGTFLLAQRPAGKPYAGYWEFPGGKVEAGESALDALVRESREELGIEVITAFPWLTRVFSYPHATVRLNFFRVTAWRGEPHPREGQQFSWQTADHIMVEPLLPANAPIIRALGMPPVYGISNLAELGETVFMQRLELALRKGLRLVQLREKKLQRQQLQDVAEKMIACMLPYGARLVINSEIELVQATGAAGVHLTSAQLCELKQRPDVGLCGASCHTAEDLRRAGNLGCDFAVLGPVLPTQTHPGAAYLGWQDFAATVNGASIPVYALGGMSLASMDDALRHGAHGIAMLRQVW